MVWKKLTVGSTPTVLFRVVNVANRATAMPSLKRDSPSITREILSGRPAFFKILMAEIGSVGATILPSIHDSINVISIPTSLICKDNPRILRWLRMWKRKPVMK